MFLLSQVSIFLINDLQTKNVPMNYNDFFESLKDELPPSELTGLEVAMWQELNNNWDGTT